MFSLQLCKVHVFTLPPALDFDINIYYNSISTQSITRETADEEKPR